MEGMKKIATRDSYGIALVELGKIHDDIVVLDADLAMATKTVLFKREFPIRNTIGYARLNVKICATHGGISVGEDGASHQCCEDFALMRTIPNMVVMSPSDDIEARQMVETVYKWINGFRVYQSGGNFGI